MKPREAWSPSRSRPRAPSVADAPYPVVGACRRSASDAAQASPPALPPMAPRVEVSEPLLAAGVPLPWSARRAFVKAAGIGAMALVACVLASAFARSPRAGGTTALASAFQMPRWLVTTSAARTARPRLGVFARTSSSGATASVTPAEEPKVTPPPAAAPAEPAQAVATAKTAELDKGPLAPATRGAEPASRASDTAAVVGLAAASAPARPASPYQPTNYSPGRARYAAHKAAPLAAKHAPKHAAKRAPKAKAASKPRAKSA